MDGSLSPRWAICSEVLFGLSEPNGTREQMICCPFDTGFLVNDLALDNQGGFYFTDSRGNSADPQGGVFYVSPECRVNSCHPAWTRGRERHSGLTPALRYGPQNTLKQAHRVGDRQTPPRSPRLSSCYLSVHGRRQTGPGSRCSEGNVYVAISGQGQSWSSTATDCLLGKLCWPDRDKGRNLKSTSLAIRPGHRELFIVANSGTETRWSDDFSIGRIRASAPFPFTSVTGMSGLGDLATPGQGRC